MSSIPTHVNGFYLRICLSAYLCLAKKTQKKELKSGDWPKFVVSSTDTHDVMTGYILILTSNPKLE